MLVRRFKAKPVLEAFETTEPLNHKATRSYELLADSKKKVDSISKDLDDGGKEITRLIRNSDELSKTVSQLAELWPDEEKFRDIAGMAKREIL